MDLKYSSEIACFLKDKLFDKTDILSYKNQYVFIVYFSIFETQDF